MTEVEILYRELSARAPYGLICSVYKVDDVEANWKNLMLTGTYKDGDWIECYFEGGDAVEIYRVRPFLRPYTDISEKEKKELNDPTSLTYSGTRFYADETETFTSYEIGKIILWFNMHHIDYMGLIPRGLALPAPNDIYKFE